MKRQRDLLIVTLALALVLAIAIYFQYKKDEVPEGLTKVENFGYVKDGEPTCAAVIPECGVCYGEIINKECYIDKQKLTDSELKTMGFKGKAQ